MMMSVWSGVVGCWGVRGRVWWLFVMVTWEVGVYREEEDTRAYKVRNVYLGSVYMEGWCRFEGVFERWRHTGAAAHCLRRGLVSRWNLVVKPGSSEPRRNL
jgi:hypothetical protein